MRVNRKWFYGKILLAIILFSLVYILPVDLQPQARATLAITLLAMTLWISEAMPLEATAILVALLLVVAGGFQVDSVFSQFFDRVVVLVLGGFAIAVAMSRHRLDEYLGYKVLGRFGSSAKSVLLGTVAVTSFLSMWMSNSAAAAIMMPIAVVLLKRNGLKKMKSNFAKSMVLAVGYGATIGGIGTIIGSTPNVITQKFLAENGIRFGFVEWGIRGFPFMVLMVIACWLILHHVFRPEIKKLATEKHPHPFTLEQKKVAAIFLLTVFLWITESVHGIHNSIIALVPIILLYLFRLIDTHDFHKVGWDSLILIGGGIALGMAIDKSGLDDIVSSSLGSSLTGQPYFLVLLAMGIVGIALTSFISNTAASAVFIPIITALSGMLGVDMTNLVVAAAIGVSLDFIFPMGTPPSALAYSTGYMHVRDMIKAGILISIAGALIMAGMAYLVWGMF